MLLCINCIDLFVNHLLNPIGKVLCAGVNIWWILSAAFQIQCNNTNLIVWEFAIFEQRQCQWSADITDAFAVIAIQIASTKYAWRETFFLNALFNVQIRTKCIAVNGHLIVFQHIWSQARFTPGPTRYKWICINKTLTANRLVYRQTNRTNTSYKNQNDFDLDILEVISNGVIVYLYIQHHVQGTKWQYCFQISLAYRDAFQCEPHLCLDFHRQYLNRFDIHPNEQKNYKQFNEY